MSLFSQRHVTGNHAGWPDQQSMDKAISAAAPAELPASLHPPLASAGILADKRT